MIASAAVDQFVENVIAAQHIPGLSLAIVKAGEPLLLKGYGLANMELSVPATAETVYEIASITKLFTATAVMMLVEDGLVELDAPLLSYLPDYPQTWAGITIRHILSHQSGLKNYTSVPEYWEKTKHDLSAAEMIGLVVDLPLDFAPGQRYSYDNTGYYLLGLLIERVSGQTYADFLADRIFRPLDMSHTRANDYAAIIPNRAAGYFCHEGQLVNKPYYSTANTFSAGILLSTVVDLTKWDAALYSDRLLKPETRDLMWTPHPSQERNEDLYDFVLGLGWFRVKQQDRSFYGHNGGIYGFASTYSHFPEQRLGVIALLNASHPDTPHELAHAAAEKLLG